MGERDQLVTHYSTECSEWVGLGKDGGLAVGLNVEVIKNLVMNCWVNE